MIFFANEDLKEIYAVYNKEIDGYLSCKREMTAFQVGRLYRILIPNLGMREAFKDSGIKKRNIAPFIAGYLSVLWEQL